MQEILQQLIFLQTLDLELGEIDKSVDDEQEELNNRSAELTRKEEEIVQLKEQLDFCQKEHRTLGGEIDDLVVLLRERQGKMMQVQTDREHTALLKEIEDTKKSTKEKEERVTALSEEIDGLKAEIDEKQNLLKGERTLFAEETEAVKKKITKINTARKTKEKARNERAKEVEALAPDIFSKYDTLRKRRNGVAVSNVDDGVCLGCYMALPPQRYNILLRGDQILECPSCQRLIYYRKSFDDE